MKGNKLRAVGAALGIVAALGVAGGLYVRTRPASLDQHTLVTSSLSQLQLSSAQIAQQTLAARHGLTPHYDPLTESSRHFADELARLERELQSFSAVHPDLAAALAELSRAAELRQDAVEHFKRKNSVLKNSLLYLPLAAQQVLAELDAAGPRTPEASSVREAVSGLVQAVLTQNLLGGREESARVAALLARLGPLQAQLPTSAGERLGLFMAHAKTASSAQEDVDPLVRSGVLGSGVDDRLTQLEQAYGKVFDSQMAQASRYRGVLYAWSVCLLFAVLAAGFQLRSVYSKLEQLVRARTQELDQALKELWGEMELARKIQTALVPRKPALRGCEVAAVMRPTSHVGGDYYDVLEVDGIEWVLIGDVSGHGVPAGLVMMMCQTAVHSVLTSQPDISPDELLATVNRTLTRNIELLGEDKYMTVSALRRNRDGSFSVAGMHQDLLVYRSRSRSVEHLPTQGTWLGICSDIRALLPVRTLRLEPGDALVLYTDGITEARRGDDMLEIEGLRAAVTESGAQSAEQILATILDKIAGYEVKDDVAAIVIKQVEPARLASAPPGRRLSA